MTVHKAKTSARKHSTEEKRSENKFQGEMSKNGLLFCRFVQRCKLVERQDKKRTDTESSAERGALGAEERSERKVWQRGKPAWKLN